MLGFAWFAVPVPNEEGPLPLVLDVKVIVDRDPKQFLCILGFYHQGPYTEYFRALVQVHGWWMRLFSFNLQ